MLKNNYQIENAYRIKIFQITPGDKSGKSVNAYLIIDKVLTLIDAGYLWAGAEKSFFKNIHSTGHKITDLKNIILTHGHVDHYGFAKRLSELSGAKVWIHGDDLHKVTGAHGRDFTIHFPQIHDFLLSVGMKEHEIDSARIDVGNFATLAEQLEDVKIIDDGHTFPLERGSLKVLHCPGHTPGSISLYDEDHSVLFSSDNLMPDRIPNAVTEPIFGKNKNYKSLKSYLKTVERLHELPASLIFPGHGEAFNEISPVRESILSYVKNFRKETIKMIGNREVRPADIARKMDPTLRGALLLLKLYDIIGILEILQEEGMVETLMNQNEIFYKITSYHEEENE